MKTTRQSRREAAELWRLCRTNGSVDQTRIHTVVGAVLASHRNRAPAVLAQLLRLVKIDDAQRTARIESAAPLDPGVRDEIASSLAQKYGPHLETSFTVNPALIGGVRITVGSDVYDGSVKAGLEAVDARFSR